MNFGGEQLGPAPTLGQTQEMLGIIGKHYPGYVGLSFLQEMGWTMTAFVNVVWPFIDAETRNRTKTVNGPQAIDQGLVESDELIEAVGGDLDVSEACRRSC